MRSHSSSFSSREPRVWISNVPDCTSATTSSSFSTAMTSCSLASTAWRSGESFTLSAICFWKKHWPLVPPGQRTNASGRSTTCGAIQSQTLT